MCQSIAHTALIIPRTEGGGADMRPAHRRFFVHCEIWHDYSFILFKHYVEVVTSYLERSGHQVSLNNPTSHHFLQL